MRVRVALTRPARCRLLVAAACWALSANAARADEWAVERELELRLAYSTNLNMQVEHPIATSELSASATAKAANHTESRDIVMEFRAGGTRYPNQTSNDAVNHKVDLSAAWRRERDQIGLSAGSLRDSTLESELSSTAYVAARRQRVQNRLGGSWTHQVNDTTSATVALGATQVRYEAGSTLADYDDDTLTLKLSHQLSPTVAISGSLARQHYKTLNNSTTSLVNLGYSGYLDYVALVTTGNQRNDADTATIGGQWQYTERLGFGVEFGRYRQRTASDQTTQQCALLGSTPIGCSAPEAGVGMADTFGATYSASASYRTERGRATANWSRRLTPSGNAALLRTDAGGLEYTHRFDETRSLALGASMTQSHATSNAGTADANLATLSSSFTWRLDEWLLVRSGYDYSRQWLTGQAKPAVARLIYFNLYWNMTPWSWSR